MVGYLVLELTLDSVSEKVERTAAELLRDVEGADRGNEDHGDSRNDTGGGKRKRYLKKILILINFASIVKNR